MKLVKSLGRGSADIVTGDGCTEVKPGPTDRKTRKQQRTAGLKQNRTEQRRKAAKRGIEDKRAADAAPAPGGAKPAASSAPAALSAASVPRPGTFASGNSARRNWSRGRRPHDDDAAYVDYSTPSKKPRRVQAALHTVSVQTDCRLLQLPQEQLLQLRQMSHKQMREMQIDVGLTSNQMEATLHHLRQAFGTNAIFQPQFRAAAVDMNRLFLSQFSTVAIPISASDTVHAVFPTNTKSLLQQLHELHQRHIDTVYIGCDAGRDFLKVCITIKWTTTSDDSSVGDHSRRRVILIFVMPGMKEGYALLRTIFDTIDFPAADVPFLFIGDLKVLNVVLGLSTAAASQPCPFCEVTILAKVSLRQQLQAGVPRTYQSCCNHADQLAESKGDSLAEHASCINHPIPLFQMQPTSPFDEVCGHPGLHYLLSANWFINHLSKLYNIDEWWRSFHYVRPSYHGGAFEGNQIRRLLRPDSLQLLRDVIDDVRSLARSADDPVDLFLDALSKFAAVVNGCFGMTLRPYWKAAISRFRVALCALNVKRLPVKFHIICAHLPAWCRRNGFGLAVVSDQWVESIHHDFGRLWEQSYKIKDTTSERFANQLLHCVTAINARHVPLPPPQHIDSEGRGATFMQTNPFGVHEGPKSGRLPHAEVGVGVLVCAVFALAATI